MEEWLIGRRTMTDRFLIVMILVVITPLQTWGQPDASWFNFYIDTFHEFGPTFWPVSPSPALANDAFVEISGDGHFEVNGEQVRFFGAQLSGGQVFPHRSRADNIAVALNQMGFNHVRLHSFDRVNFPDGAISIFTQGQSTLQLDPDALDRLEYFIAQLKENGIWVTINLFNERRFLPSDGVPNTDQLPPFIIKGVNLFDPQLVELQKVFATQLLAHVNPYTGLALFEDPVLAGVQITNENSLYRMWTQAWLRPFDQGGDIGQAHSDLLDQLFNAHLVALYGTDANLIAAWGGLEPGESLGSGTVQRILYDEVDLFSEQRVRDTLGYYIQTQIDFFAEMTTHLRSEIGVVAPINGTNWHFGQADLLVQSLDDFRDDHVYWDHPENTDTDYWTYHMNPMVRAASFSFWSAYLGGARFSGKPWTLTEFSHTFPNPYQAEGLLFFAAYGSLQQIDGVDLFSFGPGDFPNWRTDKVWPFLWQRNPMEQAMIPATGTAYRNFLVAPAEQTHGLRFSQDDVLLESKKPVVFPRRLALKHGLETKTFESDVPVDQQPLPPDVISLFSRTASTMFWYADRRTCPFLLTSGMRARPFVISSMVRWAMAKLSACCSRRSMPKTSARIASSTRVGAAVIAAIVFTLTPVTGS